MELSEEQKTGVLRAHSNRILQRERLNEAKMTARLSSAPSAAQVLPAQPGKAATGNSELTPSCWRGVSAPVSTVLF